MADRRPPSAAVLLLHGGRETGLGPPPPGPLNLPALRMLPFARAVVRVTRDEPVDVAVREVRYGHRGWNGSREDALHDAVRALDGLRCEFGEVPVVLVGHSMGAGPPCARPGIPWCEEWSALRRGVRPVIRSPNSRTGTSFCCTAAVTA